MNKLNLFFVALIGLVLAGCDQSPVTATSGNDQTTANTQSSTVNQQKTLSQSRRNTVTRQINAQSVIREEVAGFLPTEYDEANHPVLLCGLARSWTGDPDTMPSDYQTAIQKKIESGAVTKETPIVGFLFGLNKATAEAACLASQVRTASIPMSGWDRSIAPTDLKRVGEFGSGDRMTTDPERYQRRRTFMTMFANNALVAGMWFDDVTEAVEDSNATTLPQIRSAVRGALQASAQAYREKLDELNEEGFNRFQLNIGGDQAKPVTFYANQYLYAHGEDGVTLTDPTGIILYGPDTIMGQQIAFNYTQEKGAALARGSNNDRTSSSTSSSTTTTNAGVK